MSDSPEVSLLEKVEVNDETIHKLIEGLDIPGFTTENILHYLCNPSSHRKMTVISLYKLDSSSLPDFMSYLYLANVIDSLVQVNKLIDCLNEIKIFLSVRGYRKYLYGHKYSSVQRASSIIEKDVAFLKTELTRYYKYYKNPQLLHHYKYEG